jgi:hypothetical protein
VTKFEDQLFDDLMREHGPGLARTSRPAPPKRHSTARRTLLATGGVGIAAAAAITGAVVTGGATPAPAYAVTNNPDGTVTLAVYDKAGIAQANARLHQLGDKQVFVVPVAPGCPGIGSLPHARPPRGIYIREGSSGNGSITVTAKGIPRGDILVVGVVDTSHGHTRSSLSGAVLTTPPPPSCVSLPQAPPAG